MNKMESAIHLCYSSLLSVPSRQFHGANESSYARAMKFHRVATLRLSHLSMRHEVTGSFSRVNCMLNNNRPLKNEENSGNKILRGVSAASLALACVVGLFNLSTKLNPKFNTAYAAWPFSQSTMSSDLSSESLPYGSNDALDSLWKMINTDHKKQTQPKIDHEPDNDTIYSLKIYAVGLSKSGQKDGAVKLLQDTYNTYKGDSAGLNLGLALVELLIFQGEFEKARNQLHNIITDHIEVSFHDPTQLVAKYNDSEMSYYQSSISQILLYKAIIHAMLKQKEASTWWEAFITTLNESEF